MTTSGTASCQRPAVMCGQQSHADWTTRNGFFYGMEAFWFSTEHGEHRFSRCGDWRKLQLCKEGFIYTAHNNCDVPVTAAAAAAVPRDFVDARSKKKQGVWYTDQSAQLRLFSRWSTPKRHQVSCHTVLHCFTPAVVDMFVHACCLNFSRGLCLNYLDGNCCGLSRVETAVGSLSALLVLTNTATANLLLLWECC